MREHELSLELSLVRLYSLEKQEGGMGLIQWGVLFWLMGALDLPRALESRRWSGMLYRFIGCITADR